MTRPNITPGHWTSTHCGSHLQVHREGWPRDAWSVADFGFQVQDEANAKAIAAVPALLEALEIIHANAAESPEWIRRHTTAALTAAGYQF